MKKLIKLNREELRKIRGGVLGTCPCNDDCKNDDECEGNMTCTGSVSCMGSSPSCNYKTCEGKKS